MRLLRGVQTMFDGPGSVVTIGNFDGLHRGHQAVMDRLQTSARQRGCTSVLITFEPLPPEFFAPARAPGRLHRLRDRLLFLATTGIDVVCLLKFAAPLAELSAEDFVTQVLHRVLRAQHVWVGDDFRFGKGRHGDFALLERMGARLGFTVAATPTVADAEGRISSTRIRAAVQAGDFAQAEALLGRPYRLHGRVSHGDRRGRLLGFPTANLRLGPIPMALRGVYAGWLSRATGEWLPAVANIGWRPTVSGREQRLEAHVLEADGHAASRPSPVGSAVAVAAGHGAVDWTRLNLYGERVVFQPIAALRPEQRFADLAALQAQITEDVAQARALFRHGTGHGTGTAVTTSSPPVAPVPLSPGASPLSGVEASTGSQTFPFPPA